MTGVLFRLPEFNIRHCVVASANCGNLLDAIETVLFKLPCLKLWEIATPCVRKARNDGWSLWWVKAPTVVALFSG